MLSATSSPSSNGQSAVRLSLVLWGGFFLTLGPLRSPGDGDLYWQRWLGELILRTHQLPHALGTETFTAVGAPWVPQEWLFSIAVAASNDHGLSILLAILVSAIPAGVLASICLRSRNNSSDQAIALALLFSGFALLGSFGVRAQVLGWGALAAFMTFLDRRDKWYYAALPTVVLWANVHASVMVAPAIVLARVAAIAADGGLRGLRASRDVLMLPAVMIATLCTPLGWRLPIYAVAMLGSPIRHFIDEWQPPGVHDASFLIGALPIALAILAGGRAILAQNRRQAFPAALLFFAALFAERNVALFAVAAAPLAAKGLDARFPQLAKRVLKVREVEPAGITAMFLAFLLTGAALVNMQRVEPPRLPTAAIAYLASDDRDHRLFCENFTWCSIALAYPRLSVFIDGRCDPYPIDTWRNYISAVHLDDSWAHKIARYRVNIILAQRGSPFAAAVAREEGWKTAYSDHFYVAFRHD